MLPKIQHRAAAYLESDLLLPGWLLSGFRLPGERSEAPQLNLTGCRAGAQPTAFCRRHRTPLHFRFTSVFALTPAPRLLKRYGKAFFFNRNQLG